MPSRNKTQILALMTATCVILTNCVSASIKSDWQELRGASSVSCDEITQPSDAISVETFKVGSQFNYLVLRLRNGGRSVFATKRTDRSSALEFAEAKRVEFAADSEVIAFLDDVMAIVTARRNGERIEFHLLDFEDSTSLISSLEIGFGELITIAAVKNQIALMYKTYSESGDNIILINLKRAASADHWASEQRLIPAAKLVPIKFGSPSFLGCTGVDATNQARLWIYELKDGGLVPWNVEPSHSAKFAASGMTETFALQTKSKLLLGSLQPSPSFGGGRVRVAEFDMPETHGGGIKLSKYYGDLTLEAESANAAVLMSDQGPMLVMGNWLDLERTVGTYSPSADGEFLEGSRQYFGVFPENAYFDDFEWTQQSRLAWTVRTKLNHGWKFNRCRIDK